MRLDKFAAENKELHIDGIHILQSQLRGVQQMVSKMQSESSSRDAVVQALLEAIKQSSLVEAPTMAAGAEILSNLTSQPSNLALKREKAFDQMLLHSLYFKAMENRQTQIVPAHRETLRWLLDPPSGSNLADWLRSQNGIYWVNGKAGSGKSTLMKYLVSHPQTTKLLKMWAGSRRLVTASVYLWRAGTLLQKSQEGLFRTLLFEILRQSPDLIRVVCASKLAAFRQFEEEIEPWTESELREAIDLLKRETRLNARFCFFIDGLDEYDGHADEIINVLKDLCSLPDIKLCVSSRPWNEFIDDFGGQSGPRLVLEDLTQEDIRTYVKQTLDTNRHFQSLKQIDIRSQDLVQEIVDKARGVFLWVVLATRSLLDGLRNADRICDLQRRLRELPGTLEKYFSHMYSSVEGTYREQTAQTFKYVLATANRKVLPPLPLTLFSFLDEENLDAAMVKTCCTLIEPEIATRQDIMRRRLNGRCKGLVEVFDDRKSSYYTGDSYGGKLLNPTVDFIHRTAYDFLATEDMQNQLCQNLKPDFEAEIMICKAYVALLRAIDYARGKSVAGIAHELIMDLAQHVGHLETKSGAVPMTLLDEARSVIIEHEKCLDDPDESAELYFLTQIVNNGSHYVSELLKRESHQVSYDTMSSLVCSVMLRSRNIKIDLEVLNPLIEHGGGPSRAWDKILREMIWRKELDQKVCVHNEVLVGTLKKLLQYGAEPQHRVFTWGTTSRVNSGVAHSTSMSTRTRSESAQEIITEYFGEEKAREILSTKQIDHIVSEVTPSTTVRDASGSD